VSLLGLNVTMAENNSFPFSVAEQKNGIGRISLTQTCTDSAYYTVELNRYRGKNIPSS
jgi:hypothetical protein